MRILHTPKVFTTAHVLKADGQDVHRIEWRMHCHCPYPSLTQKRDI
ncbi:hypothetical protein [Paraburkholderia sartisoli]|uniref:Uncharacterized protein n=1 Tax=Paraburkholderia sartisoli TaxID=83784 RepID=A0A1H4F6G5_9BURK|nr:hypothetical protein [Paraburkholderia sartisoli]SEA92388.1 hypothetical protein SAMN05192564_104121 [Paraburkholderia sartisoli]